MTAVDQRAPAAPPPAPRRGGRPFAVVRNSWRQLTSMRTALVLLFLLALAAIPGSVLPQRGVNPQDVAAFAREHPDLAVWLHRLGGFDVYASPWFSAVYLLLFASLVGCVVPRLAEHARALRSAPPDAPRRLDRLPASAPARGHAAAPAAAAATIAAALRARRFRSVVRGPVGGSWTVSAEKGYVKETGNLLFHFALLAILVGVGLGSWYGWHGNRLLVAGSDTAFCDSLQQYDESSLGARVGAGDLPPFCLELTDFAATFEPNGQPRSFAATVRVDGDGRPARIEDLRVNSPLRLDGASVHLLGHGYAPMLRYTDRYGARHTTVTPFLPVDGMLTSEGVAMFPDVNVNPDTEQRDRDAEVAFEGVYLPTAPDHPPFVRSRFPAERAPGLLLVPYRGDLGLDAGIPGSVYELDRTQVERGRLRSIGPAALVRPGERLTLDDGTAVEFLGTRQWITISVRHDPAKPLLLAGAVAGLIGLTLSLTGRRRRVWFRIDPPAAAAEPGHSVVAAGGLPRTDYPGFADEFAGLVAAARGGTERID